MTRRSVFVAIVVLCAVASFFSTGNAQGDYRTRCKQAYDALLEGKYELALQMGIALTEEEDLQVAGPMIAGSAAGALDKWHEVILYQELALTRNERVKKEADQYRTEGIVRQIDPGAVSYRAPQYFEINPMATHGQLAWAYLMIKSAKEARDHAAKAMKLYFTSKDTAVQTYRYALGTAFNYAHSYLIEGKSWHARAIYRSLLDILLANDPLVTSLKDDFKLFAAMPEYESVAKRQGVWLDSLLTARGQLAPRPRVRVDVPQSPILYPVSRGGQFGYIDRSGALKIPLRYLDASDFENGVGKVKKYDQLTGQFITLFVDASGRESSSAWKLMQGERPIKATEWLADDEVETDGKCPAGLAECARLTLMGITGREVDWFDLDDKVGYVDATGEMVYLPVFARPVRFVQNLAIADINGQWGILRYGGDFVVPPMYSDIRTASNGFFIVRKVSDYGVCNAKGEFIVPFRYSAVGEFAEGFVAVEVMANDARKTGYLDESGECPIAPRFDSGQPFSQERAGVKIDNKWGFIDKRGELVIPLEYDAVHSFCSGVAPVMKNRKWGLIRKDGSFLVKPKFDEMHPFASDYALVLSGSSVNYVNTKGQLITGSNDRAGFQNGTDFTDGVAWIMVKNKWGMINSTGKMLIKPVYDDIGPFESGIAKVSLGDAWGYVTSQGQMLWKPSR